MKALTIRQPWAYAIVHLGKRTENRSWPTRYRGRLWIHAAKGLTSAEYFKAEAWIAKRLGWGLRKRSVAGLPPISELARGGIVAQAWLVGLVPPCGGYCTDPWHDHDSYGFKLANIRPVRFRPCKGALGLWNAEE